MRTYSTAPRDHARYDEMAYARLVAERFGTEHQEILIDERDMLGFLPRMLHHQDEPTADWTSVPQHFVTKLARDAGTVVVQVGEGADEIFHGYKGYADHRRAVVPFQRYVPRPARRPIGRRGRGGDARARAGPSGMARRSTTPATCRCRTGAARCASGGRSRRDLPAATFPDAYCGPERIWAERRRTARAPTSSSA